MQTTPAAAANPAVPVSNGVKTAYLTFDDGPSVNTPAILDILRRYEVKATFFVMGSDYIGYLKDIANDGHAIGLHTYTHNYGLVYRSTDAFFNEINTIAQVVKDVTGTQTNLLRFPGGSSNKISRQYCAKIMTHLITAVGERGYRYFDWNCDIGDAAGINIPAERLIYNIQVSKKHESLCVLMHDKDTKATTAEALPAVIEYLRGEGYSFAALGEGSPDFHHTIINN